MSAVDEFATVGSAAAGTAPGPRVENGGLPEVDPTADVCPTCGWVHQERERPVLCLSCRRHWTPNFHAICDSCESREASP